jgi:hypothetical protein
MSRLIVLLVLASVALAGCSHRRDAARDRSLEPIFSPNGEPLNGGALGHPACAVAIAGWFARVDANQDGAIDRAEFLADTRRQFALMDRDKNGEITPEELDVYRAPYAASPTFAPADEAEAATGARPSGGRQGRGRRGGGGTPSAAAGSHGKVDVSADTPDPVMSADVNLKFRVSLSDFIAYETHEFDGLDRARTGRLTLAALQALLCPNEPKP